ncbi:MAG: GGDEF domain-containing protein [Oscillospiraceae bacterium]|nr:GGDEF domain-containing protein [Oscillospiraceae bacterium]
MDTQYGYCYEARISTTDYTYITANGAFYDFRGERLLYSTFDSLLVGNSLRRLLEHIRAKSYGKIFILDVLTHDNVPCPMMCYLEPVDAEDQVRIIMIEAEKMSDRYLALGEKNRAANALLSQFDSVYFTYDRLENSMVCYCYNGGKEQILFSSGLDGWHERASQALADESQEELTIFDANLKNGIRSFSGVFTNKEGEENIRYVGTAIYNEDIHVKTVGNIGSAKIKPMQESVRRDQLTGLILKEDITNYCKKLMANKEHKVSLAIIDIDNFKNVNDRFGHATGDAVLKKCAAIINREVGNYGKAGRIGGDEFFVVFDNFTIYEEIKNILRGIKNNIFRAYDEENDGFYVSTSIGCATFPDDADNYKTLFDLTDHMLYRAKFKGKNRYITYDREKHGSVEEVLGTEVRELGVAGRRGLSKSEAVCHIVDLDMCGKEYALESILNDIMEYFIIERIVIYNKTDRKIELQRGITPPTTEESYNNIDYLYDSELEQFYKDNIMVINNIKMFKTYKCDSIYNSLTEQSVFSVMHHEITGKSGKVFVISYEMITKNITWNMEDMYLYRILDEIFAKRL